MKNNDVIVQNKDAKKIVFDMEKLNATGCVNVERTEVSGSKYYKLTYRNGTERIMNISNLKLVGYVRDM